MSGKQDEFESLARAFAARPQTAAALEECPDGALLFEAASGELEQGRRLQVVEHAARCAECAMAIRLAMELGARPSGDAAPAAEAADRPRASRRWMTPVALAASLIVAAGLTMFFLLPTQVSQPEYREGADPLAATSLVGDRLARERFQLRWSAGEPGSVYTLRVSSAELVTLLVKRDLANPEMLVPAELLAKLRTGDQVLWQVETRLPDGRQVVSETFVVTLD